MKKKKTDFRSLPKEVRVDRRKQAIKLKDEGWDEEEIAKFVGVHYKTIKDWIKKRKELEKNNYHGLKRGNPNNQRTLSENEEKEILKAITETTPQEHNIEYFLWSSKAVRELIKKKYKKTLSQQLISLYTKRWGLSSQRPAKQATERNEEKIQEWLENEYPKIKERAKKEDAEIHWADETSLNLNTNYQKTYALKGKTPVAKIPARKTSQSMISSLTNQGKLRYMVYKGGMNVTLFKLFLNRLIKDVRLKKTKKIFLIVDNLKVHHAKKIKEWEEKHKDEIEIFFPTGLFSSG